MGSASLASEAQKIWQSRVHLLKQLVVDPSILRHELETTGAPAEAFLYLALTYGQDSVEGIAEFLRVRKARDISWETVREVLEFHNIAPESALVWEGERFKQAGRVMGIPHWFVEGCDGKTDGYRPKGNLRLKNLDHVRELPERLLLGNLELSQLRSLKALPEQAQVKGWVILDGLEGISTWPKWLQACGGRVVVRNCPGLGALPVIYPPRSLILDYQPFPKEVVSFGSLDFLELSQIQGLVHLPEFLETDSLTIQDCASLESLPRRLRGSCAKGIEHPQRGLKVERCCRLTTLPSQADYPCHVEFVRCSSLQSLGEGLWVGANLTLIQLPALRSLPRGLRVPGTLHLEDLPSLSDLGEGLVVGGNLVIRNLPSLDRFPKGLKVKGDLILLGSGSVPEPSSDMEVQGALDLHPRFRDFPWPAPLRRKIRLESLEARANTTAEFFDQGRFLNVGNMMKSIRLGKIDS